MGEWDGKQEGVGGKYWERHNFLSIKKSKERVDFQ